MGNNNLLQDWNLRRKEIIDFLIAHNYLPENFEINSDYSEVKNKFFKLRNFNGRRLNVACILDEFSFESYAPECNLYQLTPENWQKEIDEIKPDIFFFESAWQGKDGLWYRKIDRYSDELFALTTYLRKKNIPIVFWNKEDPVYTDIFMLAASYADFVFTTDIDCIAKYKTKLKHDRVYHLHFAAQPKLHNPIEKFERKDKFCFAGAYYHKYHERSMIFDKFAEYFIQTNGIDIYDRNYGNARPEHAFPSIYNQYIIGNLPTCEIDKAYKGYNYGINMNSIQQSQTMFARRVFELLACNTVTVGNYSRGLKNYFGDLTISTDDEKTLKLTLDKYCKDEINYRKYRLLGLRKVLSNHLYEDRLNYITKKVFNKTTRKADPKIIVISKVKTSEEADRIQNMFNQQTYKSAELILITSTDITVDDKFKLLNSQEADKLKITDLKEYDYVTYFNPNDWYGSNYLTDLALTCRYGDYNGIGKAAYFESIDNTISVKNSLEIYKNVNVLSLSRAIVKSELLTDYNLNNLNEVSVSNDNLFSIDEFNYCQNFMGSLCEAAADLQIADQGIEISDITNLAENIKADEEQECLRIKADILSGFASGNRNKAISFEIIDKTLNINSKLEKGKHEYVYLMKQKINIVPWLIDNKLSVCFSGAGKLDLICVLLCFDKNGNKLKPLYPKLNRNETLEVPEGTEYVVIGFRVKGNGTAQIKEITFSNINFDESTKNYLLRSKVLILTNHYPQPDNLYRNMFVHKRILAYKEAGCLCDIMRMNIYAGNGFREFEGINVIEGQGTTLLHILENNIVDKVCVHFLDAEMWSILKPFVESKAIKLFVWCHGAEIQPWWRRTYNYKDETELSRAKSASEERMKLWKDVFAVTEMQDNIHFVFVSNYFANEVMEDYKIKLQTAKYSIIHNLIDTELFGYNKKNPELRCKILTIKSFASAKYANDLTTKGIVELSKRPCFKYLSFDIYGSGERFDIDNAPLKKFNNVHLHNKFLTQTEIAELHKNEGIFIATTRMDAQGVSRDEAMSSGLVPIASNCTAIPEFVDNSCGILIPEESYIEIADAIENLYNNPDLFMKLSEGAARRVRSQTSKEYTIDKEIKLIYGK